MKRRIVIVSLVVVILVVTAVLFFAVTIQPGYTNRIGCTDYEVTVVQASVITNGSGAFQTFKTISTTTRFTTTTNTSASVGHITVNTVGQGRIRDSRTLCHQFLHLHQVTAMSREELLEPKRFIQRT